MFALPIPTAAHVRTFNLRTEKHGDDDVTAMDLGMRVTGSSALLDMIHPGLRGVFYLPPDPSQASIPGESPPWTVLRCDAMPKGEVKHELVGRNVVLLPSSDVESEMRDDDALSMGSCNVNAFKITAHAGGSVDIDFRIQSNDIDSTAIGQAGAMLAQDVKLSVTHTEVTEEPAKPAEPKPLEKDATTLFVEAGKGADGLPNEMPPGAPAKATLSSEAAWPFPKAAATGAPPQHLVEPKTSKAARKRADAAGKAH